MPRETLIDCFRDLAASRGDFLVHDDGFRSRTHTYGEVGRASRAFAGRLHDAGLRKGDKVVVFGENRPEWIVAFWGCLLNGVIVVPVDYRSSPDFLERVSRIVTAKLVLIGQDVMPVHDTAGTPVWKLHEIEWPAETATQAGPAGTAPRAETPIGRDDIAEIIFTSGATAEPKGVVITHRNVLANIVPVEREILKYRKWGRPFFPLRFLNLLPLSHMFGQAMATFIPPMLPGVVIFMRGYNPGEIVAQIKSRRVSVLVAVPKILDVLREYVESSGGGGTESPARHLASDVARPGDASRRVSARVPTRNGAAAGDVARPTENRARGAEGAAAGDVERPREGRERAAEGAAPARGAKGAALRVARRWWHHREVHRTLGWKFWAFVVGAAPLEAALEAFWGELGFAVIQGYGLTETAPIVTLNHPFGTKRGSVGKAIAGVEVKIAPDGEILVRGENVTTGYFNAADETARVFEDGWFHTGDVGEIGEGGQLFIRGRKKEMIVTPEGLNVFPDDVERVLNQLPGVRESAVVGASTGAGDGDMIAGAGARNERVHAIVVVDPGVDPEAIARAANATLADHQRIRRTLVWPGPELPRTEGTRKLKRAAIRDWVMSGGAPRLVVQSTDKLTALVAKQAGRGDLSPGTTLEELGLSSLERVELMVALEDAFQTRLDEGAFAEARDLSELRRLVERQTVSDAPPPEPVDFPAWNRGLLPRAIRRASLPTWILPLARVFAHIRVEGREHLHTLGAPVIFAANHQSHMDTPVILAALGRRLRYRVAPAMAKEFFKAHFFPEQYGRRAQLTNSLNYFLASLFFNAFPLPQREAGARQTLRYIGEVLEDGFSVLIFPEGRRSDSGAIGRFLPGIGMIASRLGVRVVPVRIDGLEKVLHHTWKMARPGPVRVAFGAPMRLVGEDYVALAKQVEDAVRAL